MHYECLVNYIHSVVVLVTEFDSNYHYAFFCDGNDELTVY
jgi:hypothetical protein